MPLLLRNISKKRANLVNLNEIARKELSNALDQKIKPLLVKSHNLVVANWQHKPKFQTRKDLRGSRISMTVFPVGDNAEIYVFVDQGTKPHEIKAKNAPRLIFQTGYISKTLARPARTVAGGGKATGPVVAAKIVHHPGTEAREFSKTIAEDIRPDFNRVIDNTFRQIARMVEE